MNEIKIKRTGDLLVSLDYITEEELQEALEKQKKYRMKEKENKKLGTLLQDMGLITEKELLQALKKKHNIEVKDISLSDVDKEVLEEVDENLIKKYNFIPLKIKNNKLKIATNNPDINVMEDIELKTNYNVDMVLTYRNNVENILNNLINNDELQELANEVSRETKGTKNYEQQQLEDVAKKAPVVQLVNNIIQEAINLQASDIHIEPLNDDNIRISYRIDGVLEEANLLPKSIHNTIISRIKIMTSQMNISETRQPQDGRIEDEANLGENISLRVSTLPTVEGESAVLRILDKSSQQLSLNEIGFTQKNRETFQRMINQPNGMVLVTGPTGSGKSTTLYSALTLLNNGEEKIITLEDPVEYKLDGINQVQVNRKAGRDFHDGLRAILRQDPNILMVGEIRDSETANISIQSAQTGHLVLSTLHTKSAIETVTRLLNMEVKPYLLSSSLNGVIAQRLVRKICPECKTKVELPQKLKEVFEQEYVYEGEGCNSCNHKGYSGRTAIHEILEINEDIKEKIDNDATAQDIKMAAENSENFETLKYNGIKKVKKGITTLEELMRVTDFSI